MESPQLKTIFCEALARQGGPDRAAYLDGACRGDAALRAQVDALLLDHERIGRFMGTAKGAVSSSAETAGDKPHDPPLVEITKDETQDKSAIPFIAPRLEASGSVVGPYKLLQSIGEGGMGTVYMAEQTQPVRRTVALKLIKAGMDSRQALASFGAERQALALMDHPNIAKVFDAGTTEAGRPYFVMELVKGIPITRFCDERRLTLRERLELAIPVCQAVQHAHQKGIIHRDLKPSNVLVALYDGKPVPKVIDFGVAEATGPQLTEHTLFTEFGAVVSTLEYMSPEQAELNQLDIDTRSDVYSLGVLLYELLTGSTPLERKRLTAAAFHEVSRVIREDESPRPSLRLSSTEELPSIAACRHVEPRKLSGLVRGELDWIVMKALEKDRARRYETANGLASDLRRYLDDEPVLAGPPSSWYRLRKFARRNRTALATAVFVAAATVTVAAIAILYADRQRHFAIEQAKATREITGLAADLRNEQATLRTTVAASNRLLAIRNFERGQAAFEKDQIGPGLLWMIESWRSAIEAGDAAWQHAARAGLASWRPYQTHLKGVLSHPGPVNAACFSPDGATMAICGDDGTARLWNSSSWQPLGPVLRHRRSIAALVFSPDRKTILTGTMEAEGGAARLWDAATGRAFGVPLLHEGAIEAVAFSPDGKTLLTGSKDGVGRLWETASFRALGQPLRHAGKEVTVARFTLDGKTVVTGGEDSMVRFWDTATGTPIDKPLEQPGAVDAAALSRDGKLLFTGYAVGTGQVWDIASRTPVGPGLQQPGAFSGAAFSPDGKSLLTGCEDGMARYWELATGTLRFPPLAHRVWVWSVAISPDGKLLLTGGHDATARLWDAPTGVPLGPPLRYRATPMSVSFSPDKRSFLVGTEDDYAVRVYKSAQELPDEINRIATWIEVLTGLSLDKQQGAIHILDTSSWLARRERLRQQGGPPETDSDQTSLDPILFGSEPTARARAFMERGWSDEAETAFAEAAQARPYNIWITIELGRFFMSRGQAQRAAVVFARAIPNQLQAMNLPLDYSLVLSRLVLGDRPGLRAACSDLMSRFGTPTDRRIARSVAWINALSADTAVDREEATRLAEYALRAAPEGSRSDFSRTLGATLYRAGRLEEAIHLLNEGIRGRDGTSAPQDWAFLALAHHGLGHHVKARSWLDRFRTYTESRKPQDFWDALETRLLRSEAESVILYDPVFPVDPFAH